MTEWRKAGESPRPMMAMAAAEVQPFAQVVGDIPDEHVITVAERRVSVDYPTIIQNNMNTDTVDLVLDGEWDGMSVVCYIGHPGDLWEFEWEGEPFTLPVYDATGSIDVTVVGLSADGKTRLVTVEAKGVMNVIKSGEFEGTIPPEDQPDLLGQILAAKGEAEDAAEAANSAATSATLAATKANSAASSANSAASSANSAATKANSAAVNAENAYETLQPYMATIDSCANILHREVGPDAVVTADDSFPAKPVEMVVYGNTTQNLWVNPSGTAKGVTVTSNADGSVTLSGTSTGEISIKPQTYALKPNTQYTVSIDKVITGSTGNTISFFVGNGLQNYHFGYPGTTTLTFTTGEPNEAGAFRCGFYMASSKTGTTVSGTYRVMLNEGSTAEPWCPPGLNSVGDGGSVDIVTAGKNLLPTGEFHDIGWGVDRQDVVAVLNTIPVGTYKLSGIFELISSTSSNSTYGYVVSTSQLGSFIYSRYYQWNSTVAGTVKTCADTLTITDAMVGDFDHFYIYGCGLDVIGSTGAADITLQLELGSTATAYEPPNITTTPIDLQGHTLNALPDGTRDELHIDGGGNVVLEKRVAVASAPTAAGSWTWDRAAERGIFSLPSAGPTPQPDETSWLLCDKLPVRDGTSAGETSCAIVGNANAYAKNPAITSTATAATVAGGAKYIYKLAEPQTIDLGTITPPTMAAPNVTAYVADDTPAEMELDYVRDINIVVDRLEKKVADLVVTEATIV